MFQKCHNRTRVPQQIGMLSSSVWAVQKISGWWQIAPSPNYSQASHITVPGAHRYRSGFVACQLNDPGSHGGLV
jgi:hypothetical protein